MIMITVFKMGILFMLWVCVSVVYGRFLCQSDEGYLEWYIKGQGFITAISYPVAVALIFVSNSLKVIIGGVIFVHIISLAVIFFINRKCITNWKNPRICRKEIIMCIVIALNVIFVLMFQPNEYRQDTYMLSAADRAFQTGVLFGEDPYTGALMQGKDFNLIISPYIYIISGIAQIVRLHPTTLFHMFVPMIVIPTSYAIWYAITGLYTDDKKKRVLFIFCFMGLSIGFANYDLNATSTLFKGIWQGKAIVANVFLPLIWYYGIKLSKKISWKSAGMVLVAFISGLFFSKASLLLCPLLIMCMIINYFVVTRWCK